ncbi:MAG: transcriptional regulator GcvA [Alphaproteobacteria bacterium]|nr:transcriptional regulator GcvA [Alphaproteobacteria bacterium]
MPRRIAPLNALRAFEAAARHLSFTKAAEELHVTPAAISHQIKGLEDHFGVTLFRRMTRSILLTDAGQRVLPLLREGFDLLAEASQRLAAPQRDNMLTVSAAPSIAARWLVARLERFRSAEPDIDVRLDASDRLADFARDGVDLAIRFGAGDYPGLHVERLFATTVIPVCSPSLAAGPRPLRSPADLSGHTLLHFEWDTLDYTYPSWKMWLLAAGVKDVDYERGPRFNDAGLVLQMAVDGHGVALMTDVLTADDIAAGRLVRPFAVTVPMNFGYFVVCPNDRVEAPKIKAFRAWMQAQAAATERAAVSP